jgi:hypothetical protein
METSHAAGTGNTSGLFFESAAVRSWYSGSATLPLLNAGTLPLLYCGAIPGTAEDPVYPELTRAAPPAAEQPNPQPNSNTDDSYSPPAQPPRPWSERRSANVYAEGELFKMDNEMTFIVPMPDEANKLRSEIIFEVASIVYLRRALLRTEITLEIYPWNLRH